MSPTSKPTRPIDVYCRVSRTNGREVAADGGSAAEQKRRCIATLQRKGYSVGETFTDLDESGSKTSRPNFDKALARIASGESGGMIVLNLARFGRNRQVPLDIERIEKLGGTLLSVDDNLDTSTPMGVFAVAILAAVNALYLDSLTVQWSRSQDLALLAGKYMGPAPCGYEKLPDGKLAKINQGSWEKIAAAYHCRANGGSWSAVARELEGVTTRVVEHAGTEREHVRTNSGRWTSGAAANLLKTKLYRGCLGIRSDGSEVFRPELVTVEPSVWHAANAPKAAPGKRHNPGGALLAGLLRCAGCGRAMTKSTTKRGEKLYAYYQCKSGAQFCDARAKVKAASIESYVVESALAHLCTLAAAGVFETGHDADVERVAALEVAVVDAKAKRRAAALALDPNDPADAEALAELTAAVRVAAEALADETGASRETIGPEALRESFETGTVQNQRAALKLALTGVTVQRGALVPGPVDYADILARFVAGEYDDTPDTEPLEDIEIEYRSFAGAVTA
jgi:site-specific DNA recombinase